MPHKHTLLVLGLCLTAAVSVAAPAPGVALVSTVPGSGESEYRVQPIGSTELSPALTSFKHEPDSSVRGAVFPGTYRAAVAVPLYRFRDASFSGTLIVLEPGATPRHLVDRVAIANRPLITADGRLFIQRGEAGKQTPTDLEASSSQRIDALSIDEIDVQTGAAKTLHHFRGYTAFLAGAFADELIVYEVGADTAALTAVNINSGKTRFLSRIVPFARDFSVDAKRRSLVYVNRHPTNTAQWRIERLALTGNDSSPEVLHESASLALLPFAWPNGFVSYNPDGSKGLHFLSGESLRSMQQQRTRAPAGAGTDTVRAVSSDGSWAALVHAPVGGSALKTPWTLEVATGRTVSIPHVKNARIEVLGFAGEAR